MSRRSSAAEIAKAAQLLPLTAPQMQLVVLPAQDLTLAIDHACVAVRKPVLFAPTGAHRTAATLNVAQPYKNTRVSSCMLVV